MTRFRLDPSARRIDDGRILLGGSPLRLFRLSPAGAKILDRIAKGEELTGKHHVLTDRLIDAGAIHPDLRLADGIPSSPTEASTQHSSIQMDASIAGASSPPCAGPDLAGAATEAAPTEPSVDEAISRSWRFGPDDVTLVIPTLGGSVDRLADLVSTTRAGTAIVVDDASPVPVGIVPGARTIRLAANVGPGGARAAGFELVTTPLTCFVDTDVSADDAWIEGLLGHFDDDRVGLVAPRVRSVAGGSLRERYEMWRSPLDLGSTTARIRVGSRVSYVPGAAFIVRSEALRSVDGFNADLRWGEDVDLVWRLDAAGWQCRYEPEVEVRHEPKPTWLGWARQRYSYGTSAAPLAIEHPGALAPARVSGWSALTWVLLMGGRRTAPVGAVTALVTTLALVRKLRPMEQATQEAFRLAGLGHLFAGRILASALIRAWWPIAAIAALLSRRARRVVIAAAVVPALLDWRNERPDLDPLQAIGVRLADDLAYGVGLWRGVITARSIAPLLPDLSSWPGKRAADGDLASPDKVRGR